MSVRTAELLMGFATLFVALGLMAHVYFDGLTIGWVEGRGPGAGMWPFWLSFGMALAAIATIVRWFQGATPESRRLDPFIAPETVFLVVISAVALFCFLVLITYVGTYFALMIFMLFYVRFLGRHSWAMSLALVFGTPIFVYLLFEVALTKYLPKGLPMFEEWFLFIDDYRWKYFS